MIHFTCDACHRAIETDEEPRYVVRVEVYAAIDGDSSEATDEEDHLEEIEDLLERMDELDEESDDVLYKQVRYDLCPDCRERFLKDPLGRRTAARTGFSKN